MPTRGKKGRYKADVHQTVLTTTALFTVGADDVLLITDQDRRDQPGRGHVSSAHARRPPPQPVLPGRAARRGRAPAAGRGAPRPHRPPRTRAGRRRPPSLPSAAAARRRPGRHPSPGRRTSIACTCESGNRSERRRSTPV